jgi:hypothetical protein
MRNVRQNLAWAFGYNLLGVPIAAGALYPVFGLLLSADPRRRCDELLVGLGDHQRPAPAQPRTLIAPPARVVRSSAHIESPPIFLPRAIPRIAAIPTPCPRMAAEHVDLSCHPEGAQRPRDLGGGSGFAVPLREGSSSERASRSRTAVSSFGKGIPCSTSSSTRTPAR